MRKRSFTLLEVLISLTLLSLALGSFFFWYRELSLEKSKHKQVIGKMQEERYCDLYLNRVLPHIGGKEGFIYNDDESCIFIFDHGLHPSPLLSDAVLGRLYFDRDNHLLLLAIWPHPKSLKKEPLETHILLEDVQECSFSFYYPPQDRKKIVDPKEVGKNNPVVGWQPTWKKEFQTLPAMIKVCIKRKENIEFVYSLKENKHPIKFYRSL